MIQNAAARLVFKEPKITHVTPLFITLHWLPVAAPIKFKTLMLAYRTTTDSAPSYFHSLMTIYIPSRSPAYFHSLLQIYIPSRSPAYFHSLLRIYIPSRSPSYFHSLLQIYIPSRSPAYFHSLLQIYIPSRSPAYFHSLLQIYIPSRSPTYFHSLLQIYIPSRSPAYFHSLLQIYIPSRSPTYFHSLLRIYIPSRSPAYFHSLLQIYIPSRSLRSASERRLVVPSQRGSKSLSRTFSFTVPGWWYDLAYGTFIWKHFRSVEVVVGLVRLYRISGRRVCRVAFFIGLPGNKDAVMPKPPHERKKPSCLIM